MHVLNTHRPSSLGLLCCGSSADHRSAGHLVLIGIAALLLPWLLGCSTDDLVAISGQVTLDGNPLANGTITFVPADGKGPSAGAVIENGSYRVRVAPGSKKVQILGYKNLGQRRHDKNDPSSPMIDINEQIVPERYNKNTELNCEVDPNTGPLDFAIQTF